jgi:hypothetical protein
MTCAKLKSALGISAAIILTREALSTGGRAKTEFLSVIAQALTA